MGQRRRQHKHVIWLALNFQQQEIHNTRSYRIVLCVASAVAGVQQQAAAAGAAVQASGAAAAVPT
jgi:hypothetical protein